MHERTNERTNERTSERANERSGRTHQVRPRSRFAVNNLRCRVVQDGRRDVGPLSCEVAVFRRSCCIFSSIDVPWRSTALAKRPQQRQCLSGLLRVIVVEAHRRCRNVVPSATGGGNDGIAVGRGRCWRRRRAARKLLVGQQSLLQCNCLVVATPEEWSSVGVQRQFQLRRW